MSYELDALSNMSIGTESLSTSYNQSGGFLFSRLHDKNTNKMFEAARDRDINTVSVLLQNNLVDNYGATDHNNNTILHYLARDYDMYNKNNNLIENVLSSKDLKSFINKQNKHGDTAMHLAVKYGNVEMANKLDKAGCDMTIKNKDGLKIEAESVNSEQYHNIMDNTKGTTSTTGTTGTNNLTSADIDTVTNIINKFFTSTRPTDNFTFSDNTLAMTNNNDTGRNSHKVSTSTLDTEAFLNDIFGQVDQSGGAKKSSKKVTRGKRTLVTKKGSSGRNMSRENQLGRLIARQGSEIHKTVMDKIMKILKLNKDKQEDVEKARNYKAVLWNKVKQNSKLISNLDRSVELEKMVTPENLAKLDPKKVEKEGAKLREESRKAKEKRMADKKGSPNTTSETSVKPVSKSVSKIISNGGFSETSYSEF